MTVFAGGFDRGDDFLARGDAFTANAVGVGQSDEVGSDHRSGDVALVVEEFLPLANHAEKAVVDDGDLDVDFFLDDGGELTRGHLEAAITDNHPNFLVGIGKLRADGGRQGEAHGAESAGGDERTRDGDGGNTAPPTSGAGQRQ